MRKLFIEILGGYATIEDAIDAIREKDLKERSVILTLAVKKLFNTIDSSDILRSDDNGQWIFQGKHLSKGQRDMLIAEAEQLDKMMLWDVLKKDILYQANRKMYLLAENDIQIVTAKFWLYTFDVMKTRIKQMLKGNPNSRFSETVQH